MCGVMEVIISFSPPQTLDMNHFILKSKHPSSCHCIYHATGIYIVHKQCI